MEPVEPPFLSEALDPSVLRKLTPSLHEEVILEYEETNPEPLPVGWSRAGGFPDLPPGTAWPAGLSFLCQINLRETAELEPCSPLPKEGMLYFFFDTVNQPCGLDPKDKHGWCVLYSRTPDDRLEPTRPPSQLSEQAQFAPHRIRFRVEQRFSDPDYLGTLNDEERAHYRETVHDYGICRLSKLLGLPDLLQERMEETCELAAHGVYCGNESWRKDPAAAVLLEYPEDWRLLLQLESDAGPEWNWGYEGRLYFWIPRTALEAEDFSRTWCVLQSQ